MDYIQVNTATLSLLFFVCYSQAFNHTKFCVQNPNNTLCVYPDDEPGELCEDYESKKLGKAEKRDIILWHLQLQENALNPEPTVRVYWDSILSAIAEKWASRCNISKDLNRHYGNNTVDEHIFSVKSLDDSEYGVQDILKMSEYRVMYNDPNRTRSNFVEKLKDWKTFRIGCGMSIYAIAKNFPHTDGEVENRNAKLYELVCNYLPVVKVNKDLAGRLEARKKPRSSNILDTNLKNVEKNQKKSQSLWSRVEIPDKYFGGKYRGQFPIVRNKISREKGEDDEQSISDAEAELEEEEEDEDEDEDDDDDDQGEAEPEDEDGGEELTGDNDFEYIDLNESDVKDESSQYEGEQPADQNDLEKEIERRIDAEFGPFKGFLVSTENYGNLSAVSFRMDLRLSKVFQDFEQAGARVTSKSKFVLWAIRDSNDGKIITPKIFILFVSLIVLFACHIITSLVRH